MKFAELHTTYCFLTPLPLFSSAPRLFVLWHPSVRGFDRCRHSAAGIKIAPNGNPAGFYGSDKILKDPVHGVFVKYAEISVAQDIEFQGFQFDKIPVRFVLDRYRPGIGQTALGTDR